MKKIFNMLILLSVGVIITFIFINSTREKLILTYDTDDHLEIVIKKGEATQEIKPYYGGYGCEYYVFLPAFVRTSKITCNIADRVIDVDGNRINKGEQVRFTEGAVYKVKIEENEYDIRFMIGSKIHTLFFEEDSDLQFINASKENYSSGTVVEYDENGNIYNTDEVIKFSGRGRTSWTAEKKSYKFTLKDSAKICGMSSGKKWNLLSLFFDKTRLKSKIVYDLEKALGATYAVDNAFADVYYNGTYLGLYLITDRVDVGSGLIDVNDLDDFYKNDVIKNHDVIHQSEPFEANYYVMDNPQNITGAYLVELTPRDEIQDTEPFFTDCFGMSWKIKSPEHTTKEEVNYLYAISESLEQLSNNGDIWNYLDMDSFAKQYLIYHLCMETDQYTSSVFFVKEQNQDKILAVAPYDVDRSFGSSDISANYNTPVSLSPGSLGEKINKIYGSTLESEVAENYKEILPFCQKLIKNGIDSYVSEIDKSRKMDDMILRSFHVFDSSTYTYQEYDDEIKYLKYYFSKRLKSLSDGLSVDFDERVYVPESDGTFHNVIIKDANGSIVRNMEVIDGGQINIEGLNDTSFVLKSDRHFYDFMPVYDDLSLAIE